MFVGRARELDKMNQLYQKNDFQFAVFYGRRRVGKTTLIQEFIKNKNAIYYMAVEGTQAENLLGLSKAVLGAPISGTAPSFSSFQQLFDHIDTHLCEDRNILVIDEYPYLAASYPAVSSLLQQHIDQCWKNSPLFLILCGSSMSFMEHQVLGYKSPFYGRRTAQFKIHPFTYFEAEQMLLDYTKEERVLLYGVTDGIPEYLSRLDKNLSADENILDLFFQESGRLFEEPGNLLKQELKSPASYHSIITAIAGGASRMNEIATKTGLESSGCSAQLISLIELGIVKKEYPVTESENSRRTIYHIEDDMFRFWYRFVRPNGSGIVQNLGKTIYEMYVKPQLNDFLAATFEKICRQYLYRPEIFTSLRIPCGNYGRWWGSNPLKKTQEEIDIMGLSSDITCAGAFFAECKWRNESVDVDIILKLMERGEFFSYADKEYAVFAKNGFTQTALAYAEEHKVHLYNFSEWK
ncbi:MAG: ATP-binding protein [Roseburia sp.]|nr:ATP-binding protein [Roseburia sp.]MCM1241457.1 ATP-binding protein [Roseburia sp.]